MSTCGQKEQIRNWRRGGIRTPDAREGMPHFECGAIDHSATSPGPPAMPASRRIELASGARRGLPGQIPGTVGSEPHSKVTEFKPAKPRSLTNQNIPFFNLLRRSFCSIKIATSTGSWCDLNHAQAPLLTRLYCPLGVILCTALCTIKASPARRPEACRRVQHWAKLLLTPIW